MIKILVVSASPVEESSTDVILKDLAAQVVSHLGGNRRSKTTFVKLNELDFVPCQACGEAPTPAWCFFEDGLGPVLRELAECDCLLFGSPVYFDCVSAQGKMFIDRCNCFRPPDFASDRADAGFVKLVDRRRPGAMVLVGGKRGWFEGARRVVAGFFKWVAVDGEGMIVYHSSDFRERGEAAGDSEVSAKTEALGRDLAEMVLEGVGHRAAAKGRNL